MITLLCVKNENKVELQTYIQKRVTKPFNFNGVETLVTGWLSPEKILIQEI